MHSYYGGVKLGAGGLTRAYGQAARLCLRAAPRVTLVPEQVLTMHVPFDQLGVVHAVLNRCQVLQREEQYTHGGTLTAPLFGMTTLLWLHSVRDDAGEGAV